MTVQIYDEYEVEEAFKTMLQTTGHGATWTDIEFTKQLRDYTRTHFTPVNTGLQTGMYVLNQDYAAMQPPIGEL